MCITCIKLRASLVLALLLLIPLITEAAEPIVTNQLRQIENFTGRENILKEINTQFEKGNNKVTLLGVTGIGKTQIARKYTTDNHKKYDIIWFFNCANNLEDQYIELAKQINFKLCTNKSSCIVNENPKTVIESLKSFLENTQYKWILVYDSYNIGSSYELESYLPEIWGEKFKHILITSQKKDKWPYIINVIPFSLDDSIALLNKYLVDKPAEEIKLLAYNYNNYPLALVTVASYLKENKFIRIEEFIQKGKTKTQERKEVLQLNKLKNSLGIIVKEAKKDGELYKALILFLLLDYHNLNKELLEELFKLDKDIQSEKFFLTLSYFNQYAIIDEIKNTKGESTSFEMHDFIHSELRSLVSEKDIIIQLNLLIVLINKWLPNDLNDIESLILKYPSLLTNLDALSKATDRYKINTEETFRFKVKLLNIFVDLLYYDRAPLMIQNIDKSLYPVVKENRNLQNDGTLSTYFDYKGLVKIVHKDFVNAILDLKEAIKLAKGSINETKQIHFAYTDLAKALMVYGDIKEAIEYIDKAEEELRKCTTCSYQGYFYFTKAKIYLEKGDYDKALQSINIAIDLEKKEFKPNQFTILSYFKKAEILYHKGSCKEMNNVIKNIDNNLMRKILEDNEFRPSILIILSSNYICLGELNHAEEAINKSTKVIEEMDNINSSEYENSNNIYLAYALFIKGEIEYFKNNYKQALKYYNDSLIIYKTVSPKLSMDINSKLIFRLSEISTKVGNKFDAKLYKLMHEKIFSIQHNRTQKLYELNLMSH